jgi:hypothetical protein
MAHLVSRVSSAPDTYDPEIRSAKGRAKDMLSLPGQYPDADVYRWEDDGGAVLVPAEPTCLRPNLAIRTDAPRVRPG